MKNWLKTSLLSVLFVSHAIHACEGPALAVAAIAPHIAANVMATYRSAVTFGETFQPNLDNLNVFTITPVEKDAAREELQPLDVCRAIKEGRRQELDQKYVAIGEKQYQLSCEIPSNTSAIVVHSPGYDGYLGSAPIKFAWAGKEAINLLKNNIIPDNTPVVCFEGPVNYPSTFSFGGAFDQKCLDFVYNRVKENNPKASIILSGDCKGATGVLNYLINPQYKNDDKLKPVKAVFLESPSSSLAPFAENVANNHVPSGLRWTIPLIFKGAFHNCKWNEPTILDKTADIPDHIKLHIGYLCGDKAANPRDTAAIVQALQNAHKEVESFEDTNLSLGHGHLGQSTGYQQSVRAFLDRIVQK